jgi:hypothetical protein
MSEEIYRSEKLGLNFKIKNNAANKKVIVFEDGINYQESEVEKLKTASEQMIKNAHALKKIFGGVIV